MMIRKMTDEDISSVSMLDSKVFSKSWNEQMFCDEIKKDYAHYFVCEMDGEIVGYAGIWCIYETAELMRIGVLPTYRGRGIGKQLMDEIGACAKSQGCERMMLEVRKSNEKARKLYEKDGFSEISVRKGYYDGEDAIIMERVYK